MELKVISKSNDKYFDRTLITFSLKTESKETVKIDDVKKKLAEHFPEGFLVVYTLKNVYGSREINGIAHVYKDEESAKKVLQKFILKKNGVIYAEKQKEEKGTK